MHYQIYLDSFLMQEIIVSFYVLELCKICLMCTATHKRIILASLFMGLYQIFLLMLPFPQSPVWFYFMVFILYSLGSLLVVLLAFGKKDIHEILKQASMYLSLMIVFGGIFMGFLPRFSFYRNSKVKVLLLAIAGVLVYGVLKYLMKKKTQNTYYGQMKLCHQGIVLEGKYFMDSGNGLIESISGKPVMLADEKWLEPILNIEGLMCRPIIYKSVGKSKGILYAYCIDKLVIYGEKDTYTYEKVWVGVCKEKLLENQNHKVILPLFYGQMR